MENTLYFGDNLPILKEYITDNSIDLIYLDPPFKSDKDYNLLFTEPTGELSEAQITAFEDTWHWTEEAERTFEEIINTAHPKVVEMIAALRAFIGPNDVMAYLVMMTIRLIELHRVLKETGSIFLHCDPTASHYLKILMDTVFDKRNFKNEIIWHYRKWPSGNRQFQRNHDCILFYAKTDSPDRVFNQVDLMERTASTLKRFGRSKIISGYDDKGKRLPSRTDEEESIGVPRDDVWDIGRVPPIKQLFPTQKPDELLSRIIRASSNEGDIILDPFCGCGTTVVVAHALNRTWIGIDITHLAIDLIKRRLKGIFHLDPKSDYQVIGEPEDLAGARELAAQNPYQFQCWACALVDARPNKKGADEAVDGRIYFSDEKGKVKKAIVSVKSGKHISIKDIRELIQVTDAEKAEFGVFLTLKPPTKNMERKAVTKGFYTSPLGTKHPRIQIRTIEELLKGHGLDIPLQHLIHRKPHGISLAKDGDLPFGAKETEVPD